jgi:hypothetical protein
MAQDIEPRKNDPALDDYQAPAVRPEPGNAPTDEIIRDLSLNLDRSEAGHSDARSQRGIMQPMVWTMMLLVVLLGGWTFLVQEPVLEPGALDLDSFSAVPEILQVQVIQPDVVAQISINRWMKLRPASRVGLMEDASRIAATAGYDSLTFNGTDGSILARWRRADGVRLLHPKPESVNVQLR